MTVFMVEEPRLKYDDARVFGEVKFIFFKKNSPRAPHLPGMMRTRLVEEGYDPETDYICLTGRLSMVTMLVAVASQIGPKINLLLYNEGDKHYTQRSIEDGRGTANPIERATGIHSEESIGEPGLSSL